MMLPYKCGCCKELWEVSISFSFVKDGSFYPSVKGMGGSIEAPVLSIWRIGTALIMASTQIPPGHSAHLGTILNKKITAIYVSLCSINVDFLKFLNLFIISLTML